MVDLAYDKFTIRIPDDWKDRTEVVLKGPSEDGISPTLTVVKLDLSTEQTLAQFAAFQLHGLQQLLGLRGVDVVSEGESMLAGVNAYTRVYNLRFQDELLTQTQIYIIRAQAAYVITATTGIDHYQKDHSVFEDMIKTFQFRSPVV